MPIHDVTISVSASAFTANLLKFLLPGKAFTIHFLAHRVREIQGRREMPWNTSWWRHQFKTSSYARALAHDKLTCLLRSASFCSNYCCDCSARLLQRSSSGLHNRHFSSSNMPTEVVVGLGDPIVDVLVPVSHAEFDELGLQRGGSTPLNSDSINRLMSQLPQDAPRNKCALVQHQQNSRNFS